MARDISKLMFTLLMTAGVALNMQGENPDPVHAGEQAAVVAETVDEKVAAPEIDVEELQHTIKNQASEITMLKLDLANEKLSSRKLSEENAEMRKVVECAMPLMERNIQDWRILTDTVFAMIDYDKLKNLADEWRIFAPYSEKYSGALADVGQFMQIAGNFRKYSDFDTEPYSEILTKNTTDGIMELSMKGGDILLPVHAAEIDRLYEKADSYADAVKAFDGLIKAVDTKLEPNRENPSADKLCRIDYESVMQESAGALDKIKDYRYLSSLLLKYTEELEKQPRSLTETVRSEISAMLSGSVEAPQSETVTTEVADTADGVSVAKEETEEEASEDDISLTEEFK